MILKTKKNFFIVTNTQTHTLEQNLFIVKA